jgi:hypothetical protein
MMNKMEPVTAKLSEDDVEQINRLAEDIKKAAPAIARASHVLASIVEFWEQMVKNAEPEGKDND